MAYATKADLLKRMPEHILSSGATGFTTSIIVSDDVIAAHLDDASSLIDNYISSTHILPITNPPQILKKLCCDIAIYTILCYRGFNPVDSPADSILHTNYRRAIYTLEQAANGKVIHGLSTVTNMLAPKSATPRGW